MSVAQKRTLEQIEMEIAQTKAELLNVHGTETEVYARIVGYYRAVKHWNKGKRDEYNMRKMFTLEDSNLEVPETFASTKKTTAAKKIESESAKVSITKKVLEENPVLNNDAVTYELFTRKTCPNCPPVKDFMENLDMVGRKIDVDTQEGLAQAAKNGVFASPTVIFYNKDGIETARCHNVEELKAVFAPVTVNA